MKGRSLAFLFPDDTKMLALLDGALLYFRQIANNLHLDVHLALADCCAWHLRKEESDLPHSMVMQLDVVSDHTASLK